MGSLKVTLYRNNGVRNYELIASAMRIGIPLSGDRVHVLPRPWFSAGDVGLMYGWKHRSVLRQHKRFMYADLGYWQRDLYWRFASNDWSPAKSMRRGMPNDRLKALGVEVLPEHEGEYVLVLGASQKSMVDHGEPYLAWETRTCNALLQSGARVLYRPKPKDRIALPIQGTELVSQQSIRELFAGASIVVSHHSNGCVEAIAAGCAVHCSLGVAKERSVALEDWRSPPRIAGREQFLADVAYTQWTLEEMRNGAAWSHMRQGVLR